MKPRDPWVYDDMMLFGVAFIVIGTLCHLAGAVLVMAAGLHQ